jgi:phage-related protein
MPRTKLPILPRTPKPHLTITLVLKGADEFHGARGRWPNSDDGVVTGTADEKWGAIDRALTVGNRGLPGGTTLAKLLLKHRGRPHYQLPPDLTIPQILAWADAFHRKTGEWPGHLDGTIPKTRLTWSAVHTALVRGKRGLPGGTSITRLLEQHRGVRNHLSAPPLTEKIILRWADDHHHRTGHYPKHNDGPILAEPRETWSAVENALIKGSRGLPGSDSLAKFLARHRGVRNKAGLPPLSVEQIKTWAEAHKTRTGRWPTVHSGRIQDAPGESWAAVHGALDSGLRGLPGGDSLARLLARECGRRNLADVPRLTLAGIRRWVLLHHELTGGWPTAQSGPIMGVPGETWAAVTNALQKGRRGLRAGATTLAQIVRRCREV